MLMIRANQLETKYRFSLGRLFSLATLLPGVISRF